jgi:hypothetical protein
MSSRTVLISVVIVLLALCACAAAIGVAGGALYLTTAQPAPLPTLDATQMVDQREAIQAWVIAHRGLQPSEPVPLRFMTVEEVRQRTIEDFEEDTSPEEMADHAVVLSVYGLMQPDVDLYDLYIRLYSEGVSGFYDPDEKEMVLVSETGGFDVYERVVFAHEYTHALQDQVFDIRESGFSEEMFDTDPERAVAIQAVLEGDASLVDEQYLESLSRDEQREYDRIVRGFDTAIYREMPEFLLHDFVFPYQQGLDFVRRYYDQGGWAAVDDLWRDPPVSTEHILHPERYEAGDLPVPVARPALTDTLGSGWRLFDEGVMGEWYTYLILAFADDPSHRLPRSTAARAAEGWGGDAYLVYGADADGRIVMATYWVWDTNEDAAEFASAFRDYAGRRFGPADEAAGQMCWIAAQVNCLFHGGLHTLWLMAPDPATMEIVRDEFPDF